MAKLKITLVKSPIACQPKQKKTVEALGLRKLRAPQRHLRGSAAARVPVREQLPAEV